MTQTIEQLQAKVAELEEENARLKVDRAKKQKESVTIFDVNCELRTQLAAEQLNNKLLREALTTCVCAMQDYQAGIGITEMFDKGERLGRKALASPSDTSALDSFVAEKVTRPNFSQMREMLRAMQAGELTVSRGIEILDMWHAGNWNDDMLPPVRQDLIEEDSMPVEIIDRLTRQRDLAVEALKWLKLIFTDSEMSQERNPELWMPTVEEAIKESEVK